MAESAPTFRLGTALKELPGVGDARRRALQRLGLHTVTDLLRHYPTRYEKESAEAGIDQLPTDGKTVGSARGEIADCRWVPGRGHGRKGRFEATLEDDTATLRMVWFNAGYLRDKLHPGQRLRVQGKAKLFNGYPQMANPKWERLPEDDTVVDAKSDRLRPVYPATEGLDSPAIERLIEDVLPWALPLVPDPVPSAIVQHHAMPTLAEALRLIHRPEEPDDHKTARRRLAFNELLLLQSGVAMKRAFVDKRLAAPPLHYSEAVDRHIRERFPFELTDTQGEAVRQIAADLQQTRPMNRMLQGDVGAGKTVVALYAMLMAGADRKQAALMAPTELLSEQHADNLRGWLAPLGVEGSAVRLALLTGQRKEHADAIAAGEVDLVVGTHALLSESVAFKDLAVVVIDEQHRFGVMQRAGLRRAVEGEQKMRVPHTLVMTATPIPRTLSLTLFGDLEHTILSGLPPGRTPIQNRVVGPETADEVYRYAQTRVQRGEQAYVVVPAIDAAGKASGSALKSVNQHAKLLAQKYFPDHRVEVVHGRLKAETRQRVMQRFRDGDIDVLVATTVIEVGVDVPNATVMVIEHAERFGLAQLHQLRGRVGRGGGRRSLCVFIAEPTTEDAEARMEAVASTNDGFKIAELDLEIRGMGEILGTRQHGAPPLRLATLPDDMPLLQLAKRDAAALIEADPDLSEPDHELLRKVLFQQYGEVLGLVDVG